MNPFITVAPSDSWMHIVVSISGTEANIYVNDQLVKNSAHHYPYRLDRVFFNIYWLWNAKLRLLGHYSDLSQYDELRIFTKALSADEYTV